MLILQTVLGTTGWLFQESYHAICTSIYVAYKAWIQSETWGEVYISCSGDTLCMNRYLSVYCAYTGDEQSSLLLSYLSC